LVNGRAGEVRLETDLFVWQRDNTTQEPLFNRAESTRYRIRALRLKADRTDSLYRVVVLQPGDDAATNRSKTLPRNSQKSRAEARTRKSRGRTRTMRVEDLGFTPVRRRKIRTFKARNQFAKVLPLCRGGRFVSPVC